MKPSPHLVPVRLHDSSGTVIKFPVHCSREIQSLIATNCGFLVLVIITTKIKAIMVVNIPNTKKWVINKHLILLR